MDKNKITCIDPNAQVGDLLHNGAAVIYTNRHYALVANKSLPNGDVVTFLHTGKAAHLFPVRRNADGVWEIGLLLQGIRYDRQPGEVGPEPKGLGGYANPNETLFDCVERHALHKVGMRFSAQAVLFNLPRFLPIGTVDVPIAHLVLDVEKYDWSIDSVKPVATNELRFYTIETAVELAMTNQVFDSATADGIHKVAHWIRMYK